MCAALVLESVLKTLRPTVIIYPAWHLQYRGEGAEAQTIHLSLGLEL